MDADGLGVGPLADEEEEDEVGGGGDGPADRVGEVEHLRRAVQLEDGGHPQQPQGAGAHQGHDHGHHRVADAPEHAHLGVHQAAEEVGGAADGQPVHRLGDDLLLAGGVDGTQGIAEEVGQIPQHQADEAAVEQAQAHDPVHPLALAGAVVLAGKGQGRLVKGVHAGVDEALDVGGGGGAGHHGGAEGVDGGLDDHVGDGEHHALEPGGQAHLEDAPHHLHVQPQRPQVHPEGTLVPHQGQQHQDGGHVLGDDGSQGHAGHVHMEDDDEHQVQNHVDDTCGGEEVEGPLGVPLGPEDGGAEVIEHVAGHSAEVDPQVHGGQADDVLRGAHELQHLPAQQQAQAHQHHAADQGQGDGGVDAVPHILLPAGPQVPGHHHVGAHGEAHKEVDHQVDEGGIGAHRRQGLFSRPASHHDDIGGVEQELQDAGEHQRDGKHQELPGQGAVDHVDLVALALLFHFFHRDSHLIAKIVWAPTCGPPFRQYGVISQFWRKNNPKSKIFEKSLPVLSHVFPPRRPP